MGPARASEGRPSFCKQKEAKKLHLYWTMGTVANNASGPA
jgi:hypothetical protein